MRHCHPAGIKPKFLTFQHNLLAIISCLFLIILISLGYGETKGVPHKSKSIAELGQADQKNEWFEKGMEAVSLAPTAVNQQKFYFELKNGIVTAKNLGGFYSRIDLGIVKYHFEAVTGHEVK